ncbi:unnamed protein product, partial [Discosporangium mesarthrocarpum]
AALLGGVIAAAPLPALADPVADFYKGRTVTVAVGGGPVGGYAIYARLAIDHMARHVPGNPKFIFQTMPGGGGLKAANFAYKAAPKDGTYMLMIVQNIAVNQAMKAKAIRYNAPKFNYIGRFTDNTALAVGWVPAGVTSVDVLRSREVITGSTGPSSPTNIIPKVLNLYGGAKYKVISGYKGVGKIMLAMESGEVQAMVGSWVSFKTSFAQQVRAGKVKILAQMAPNRHRELPDVPTVAELALNAEGRAVAEFLSSSAGIGRALAVPPGVPADRIAALRAAHAATVKDPDFLAEIKKRNLDLNPADHAVVEKIVMETLATPPAVIAKAAAIARKNKKARK